MTKTVADAIKFWGADPAVKSGGGTLIVTPWFFK